MRTLLLYKMSFHYKEFQSVNNLSQVMSVDNQIFTPSFSQIKLQDQYFIEKWLFQFKEKNSFNERIKPKCFSMPELRSSLGKVFELCKNIEKLQQEMRKNVSVISSEDWAKNIALLNTWKSEISNSHSWNNEKNYEELKKKLAKRLCKRARLRRRKDKIKLQKMENAVKKSEINCKIDDYLSKMRQEIEKKKEDEKMKCITDNVLRDVTKQKTDARRCLALLEALKKLRDARLKSALGRGDKVSSSDAVKFSTCIEKLVCIWSLAMEKYTEKEKNLNSMLKKYQITENKMEDPTSSISRPEITISQWKHAMFGTNTMPQRDFQGDLEKFISIRMQWDQFISSSEGSSLPIGWVIPSECKNSNWNQHLTND